MARLSARHDERMEAGADVLVPDRGWGGGGGGGGERLREMGLGFWLSSYSHLGVELLDSIILFVQACNLVLFNHAAIFYKYASTK